MTAKVYLPRVSAVRLIGVQPVFKRDFQRPVPPGINIVLGGNGLGKTTTMQAITFALTGGLNNENEPMKTFRWDHKWFNGRVDTDKHASAFVEVEFALGDQVIGVRRCFGSSRIQATRLGSSEWIDSRDAAEKAFAHALRRAGYRTTDDFSLVVIRLLYLSENRRLLAWDPDTKPRVLMILSPEVINEHDFRTARAKLKRTDSTRRHTHVAVEKLREQVQPSLSSKRSPGKPMLKATIPSERIALTHELQQITDALVAMPSRQRPLTDELAHLDHALAERSEEIEDFRSKIDENEAHLVCAALAEVDNEIQLPLTKLLQHGICPACGTFQASLRAAAQAHADHSECLLCGSEEETAVDESLSSLYSQIAEKLKAQREIDDKRRPLKARLDLLRREEAELLARATEARRKIEVLPLPVSDNANTTDHAASPRDLQTQLQVQEQAETQLLAAVQEQKASLGRTYSQFMRTVAERTDQLRKSYEQYATTFLGIKCTLEERATKDRLFAPRHFVPKFNGVIREVPESCSEAQQFFLDIAFRMAFVDLACELSGKPGSFLCETPEKALDLSYIENVAKMFTKFAAKGHSVVLTANIQKEGLANHLSSKWSTDKYDRRVLQLIDFSQLSEVQRRKKKDLKLYSRGKV